MDRVARRGPLARAPRALVSQCRKKLEGGTLWDFPTSILSQNIKKMQGGPLRKNVPKKIPKKMSRSAEKNEAPTKKCPLSPHCYLTKKNQPL